ncbi:bifunctional PIG-L family deacetylase/class I SAM-dependent methyltransferase [Rhodoglobus sp. NPDC076762]
MVKFDHRDPGTPEAQWISSAHWRARDELDVSGIERLIVVSAHPDDETLGAAGLMQRVSAAGGHVVLVLATDGEGSHPDSKTRSAAELRAIRASEIEEAIDLVAPGTSILRLRLRDGALKYDTAELRTGIEGAFASGRGRTLIAATWRGDGHGDHRVVGETCAEIARAHKVRFVEYPIWLWHWSSPDDPHVPWAQLHTVTLSADERETKRRAIAAHESQVAPLSDAAGDEAILRPDFVEHFDRPMEAYVVTEPEDDGTLTREFFDDFYEGKVDPWGFETRWYEQRKRALTLASLPRERFARALELGCSIGVLSAQLAPRCDALLGTEIAQQPLEIARQRLAEYPHVSLHHVETAEEWPAGTFDLIVLSEVGYYFDLDALDRVLARAVASLAVDGTLVACHWRHEVKEYPLSGDQVHQRLNALDSLERFVHHREEDFLLEVFSPRPASSVARQTGLL